MSLFKQDNISKKRVKKVLKLDAGNDCSKKYKIEAIWDSAVCSNKLDSNRLPGLYHLIA